MSRYLLSVHMAAGKVREPMSEEDMRRGFERSKASSARCERRMPLSSAADWANRARPASSGHRMAGSAPSTVHSRRPRSSLEVYIIEAGDLSAAVEWASKVTLAIDTPIEVRPFVDSRD